LKDNASTAASALDTDKKRVWAQSVPVRTRVAAHLKTELL